MEVSVILEKYKSLGYVPKSGRHCTRKVKELTAELVSNGEIRMSQLAELLQTSRQTVHKWCSTINRRVGVESKPTNRHERRRILRAVASGALSKRDGMNQLGATATELNRWLEDQNLHLSNTEQEAMGRKKVRTDESLQQEIARLKEALAQEKLKVESLETVIDIAEKELKVSIRKKSGTR